MSQAHIPFTLSDPDWYDIAWAPGSPLLATSIQPPTPPGWRHWTSGPWTVMAPTSPRMPDKGWKIHIAALPQDAADVVRIASSVAARHDTVHKMLRSRELVHATQLKYADPTTSGKVVVCYPDEQTLEPLCLALAAELPPRDAPSVRGELQLERSPLWLRHGSFIEQWARTVDGWTPVLYEAGKPVTDHRGPHATAATTEPPFIRDLRAAAPPPTILDISDVQLLHRTNAGGVYRGTWKDGRPVVVKEARPHSGLDAVGVDAATRLGHEHAVLQRLATSGVAPAPIELLVTDDGSFLVMDHIAGSTLAAELSRRHPVINPASLHSPDEYLAWVDDVRKGLDTLITVLERHGVVHGDMQPANLVCSGGGLVALDFESATLDNHRVATGITTPGVSRSAAGALTDPDSTHRIHTILINPVATPVLARQPEREDELREVGLHDLHSPTVSHQPAASHEPAAARLTARLLDGILHAATPDRDDRLFPGDIAQFHTPTAGTSLLHGASGVILTLKALQTDMPDQWIRWLEQHASHAHTAPGFATGIHGTASALARLTTDIDLLALLRPHRRDDLAGQNPALGDGIAGHALAWQHLAEHGAPEALETSLLLWRRLESLIHPAAPALDEGLMTGWAGIGLAVLSSPLPERNVLARTCLTLALRSCTPSGPLLWQGHRITWPYLGRGAAAVGLLADALDPGGCDSSLQQIKGRVVASCRAPLVYSAGLMNGRAGLLLTLRHLAPQDPAVHVHSHRLAWLTHTTRKGDLALLGDHSLRASIDVASGSAGALVALHKNAWPLLRQILGLGR